MQMKNLEAGRKGNLNVATEVSQIFSCHLILAIGLMKHPIIFQVAAGLYSERRQLHASYEFIVSTQMLWISMAWPVVRKRN